MTNLEIALAAAGARLVDVVKTTAYVASANQADLVTVWDVVRDRFGTHEPPSTLLGVAALGYHDQLVEVEAVAAGPRPRLTGRPAVALTSVQVGIDGPGPPRRARMQQLGRPVPGRPPVDRPTDWRGRSQRARKSSAAGSPGIRQSATATR